MGIFSSIPLFIYKIWPGDFINENRIVESESGRVAAIGFKIYFEKKSRFKRKLLCGILKIVVQ